jgi:LPS export ABC transporter protein LptC
MKTRSLLGCVLGCLLGCAADRTEEAASPTPPASPHVALEGVRIKEGAGNQQVWELEATHVRYRPDGRVADMQEVQARFYEDGKVVSRATAPAAELRLGDRHFTLSGGIHLRTPDGTSGFEAGDASWHPDASRLEAHGPVRFWRPGGGLQAAHLHADRALRRVELGGGVNIRAALPADLLTVKP